MKAIKTLVLAMTMIAVASQAGFSQVVDVTIDVDGLACPFCAYSLEKKLKDVDGVGDLIIDVKKAHAVLTPHQDKSIAILKISKAVKDAGFTPREMHIRAKGRIVIDANGAALFSPSGEVLFPLVESAILSSLRGPRDAIYEISGTLLNRNEDLGRFALRITNATMQSEETK